MSEPLLSELYYDIADWIQPGKVALIRTLNEWALLPNLQVGSEDACDHRFSCRKRR